MGNKFGLCITGFLMERKKEIISQGFNNFFEKPQTYDELIEL